MTVDWGGSDERMIQAMDQYRKTVLWAVEQVAQYFAAVLEAYAKKNAPWTDQTSNARQALHGYVDDAAPETFNAELAMPYPVGKLAQDIVTVYLSHGMIYGIPLEMKYGGKYAIIWPTIEEHLPKVEAMLKGIFGR